MELRDIILEIGYEYFTCTMLGYVLHQRAYPSYTNGPIYLDLYPSWLGGFVTRGWGLVGGLNYAFKSPINSWDKLLVYGVFSL
ncbi:hypothetical protein PYJP_12610 [Pyrofollis japonicus]|nr:hypothetical protein PYJP_12610 [Pyrofollis japonicus]